MLHLSAARKTYLAGGAAIATIVLVVVLVQNFDYIAARWLDYRGFDGLGPERSHEDIFEVAQLRTISIENFRGGVQLRGEERDTVRIETRIYRADRVKYQIEQDGEQILVRAIAKHDTQPWGDVNIKVTVPASFPLVEITSTSSIRVENVATSLVLSSPDRMHISDFTGELIATGGSFASRTPGFNIDASIVSLDADLNATNIQFSGDFSPGSVNELRSYASDFDVDFDQESSIEFDAATVNGEVRYAFPIVVESAGTNHLRGTVGTGDTKLTIRSEHGDILVPAFPNCYDFLSWEDANRFFLANGGPERDPRGLDLDRDGIPCEQACGHYATESSGCPDLSRTRR